MEPTISVPSKIPPSGGNIGKSSWRIFILFSLFEFYKNLKPILKSLDLVRASEMGRGQSRVWKILPFKNNFLSGLRKTEKIHGKFGRFGKDLPIIYRSQASWTILYCGDRTKLFVSVLHQIIYHVDEYWLAYKLFAKKFTLHSPLDPPYFENGYKRPLYILRFKRNFHMLNFVVLYIKQSRRKLVNGFGFSHAKKAIIRAHMNQNNSTNSISTNNTESNL